MFKGKYEPRLETLWNGYGYFLEQHNGKFLFPCVSDLKELVFSHGFSMSNNFCYNNNYYY